MKRKIGVFGLATLAALAFAAAAGSAAQAFNFTSSAYPAILSGEPGGANTVFKFAENPTECTETGLSATLPEASNVLEIERSYGGCSTTIGGVKLTATIRDNECKFRLTIGKEIEKGAFASTVDIVCPTGKKIEVRVYKSAFTHILDSPMCRYTVGAQSGLTGVRLTNLEGSPKAILVAPTVTEISYGIIGGGECGEAEAEFHNGTYTGKTEMIGHLCCANEPVDLAVK
jgi:hypothetical protein